MPARGGNVPCPERTKGRDRCEVAPGFERQRLGAFGESGRPIECLRCGIPDRVPVQPSRDASSRVEVLLVGPIDCGSDIGELGGHATTPPKLIGRSEPAVRLVEKPLDPGCEPGAEAVPSIAIQPGLGELSHRLEHRVPGRAVVVCRLDQGVLDEGRQRLHDVDRMEAGDGCDGIDGESAGGDRGDQEDVAFASAETIERPAHDGLDRTVPLRGRAAGRRCDRAGRSNTRSARRCRKNRTTRACGGSSICG
jgi:hypothetical protein